MEASERQFETGATLLIDEHYASIGLDRGWKAERANRLCAWLKITPQELGKACCVSFHQMNRWLNLGEFPAHVSLHFALIESYYVEQVLGIKQEPIVPIHLLVK